MKAAIIAIGVVIGMGSGADAQTLPEQITSARGALYSLVQASEQFYVDNGRYPGEDEGLAVLAAPPSGYPYVTRVPNDPWGRPYRYRLLDDWPVIDSAGPDGVFGTADDISSPKTR